MSARQPWGHTPTKCARCGKVGPRCFSRDGKIHAYCRTPEEKLAERIDYEKRKIHAQYHR